MQGFFMVNFKSVCLTAVFLLPAANAMAALSAGDLVKFSRTGAYSNNGGGEFRVTVQSGPNSGFFIYTFCLEISEHVNFSDNFIVVDVNSTQAVQGGLGPNPDPISVGTGILYQLYAESGPGVGLEGFGGPNGYTRLGTTSENNASAAALQGVIWRLEQEVNGSYFNPTYGTMLNSGEVARANNIWNALLNTFFNAGVVGLAQAEADARANYNALAGGVRVMNITFPGGANAQSQLYFSGSQSESLPEPATFAAWSSFIAAGALFRRRKKATRSTAA